MQFPAMNFLFSKTRPRPFVEVLAVGGVGEKQFGEWFAAGAAGFGMGGELYRAGMTTAEIARRAKEIVSAYKAAKDIV